MSYQVIARKYRPQRFSDVVGQDHVSQTLANAISSDRIAHAYLFAVHVVRAKRHWLEFLLSALIALMVRALTTLMTI